MFQETRGSYYDNSQVTTFPSNVVLYAGILKLRVCLSLWKIVFFFQLACRIVSIATHYFLSASFCWMLAEGIHIYNKIVRVFGSKKYNRVFCVLGWGTEKCFSFFHLTCLFPLRKVWKLWRLAPLPIHSSIYSLSLSHSLPLSLICSSCSVFQAVQFFSSPLQLVFRFMNTDPTMCKYVFLHCV